MITVGEAQSIISGHLFAPTTIIVALEDAVGSVLAETVKADRDLPPFDRVAMDGIAIGYTSWLKGQRTFEVAGVQQAGQPQQSLADPAQCMEVMTGAILPAGCDTVIRYEDVSIHARRAEVAVPEISLGQSIHRQGADARQGEILLGPGCLLAPSEIALLASVGKSKVSVFRMPRVAVISTGDELVAIDAQPSPFQVRRSNAYALQAALRETGCDAHCFHLADDRKILEESLEDIANEHDVLVLSGGVSKGKFDFVPAALESIGIRKHFHQVSQRPGKPFWFGSSASGKVAFALPGNPVSTFMCFYRYVKPWLLKSLGVEVPHRSAALAKDFSFPAPLTFFLQVEVKNENGREVAWPHPGGGSGDFANLKTVTGFLELPLEKNDFRAGEVFPLISFRH